MSRFLLMLSSLGSLLALADWVAGQSCFKCSGYPPIPGILQNLDMIYQTQPMFVTILPYSEENCLIDNICYTSFQLPDNNCSFIIYKSTVYYDGSNQVNTFTASQLNQGISTVASTDCILVETVFAVAPCDTYLNYNCFLYGDCQSAGACQGCPVFGLSPYCCPISVACFSEAKNILQRFGFRDQEYIILPMEQPTQCVTSQVCENAPAIANLATNCPECTAT